MKPKFSIVIPVYNSEKNLKKLYNLLVKVFQDISERFEIIFIDDNSKDSSFEVLKDISSKDNRVVVIKLKKNFGQQNAVFCGLNFARGDYTINLDDDLQHNPKYIKNMYEKIKEGYDVVYAVTKVKYHKKYRNLGSKLTDKLFNFLLNKPSSKRVSSYRIIRKTIVDKVIAEKRSYNYISASLLKHTKNIGNYYYKHSQRKYGSSNYTFLKQFKIFLRIYLYYTDNKFIQKLRTKKEPFEIEDIIDCRCLN